ncbi:hypothetical protein BRDCF_p1828 [Bacteroidales bacterium CF]|jgi:hypothetical protein|nr:hypothetical protein BRDCF_p1828 [Bacteroidales bacterium CF]
MDSPETAYFQHIKSGYFYSCGIFAEFLWKQKNQNIGIQYLGF